MGETYIGRDRDDAGERASAHMRSGGTLVKTAAYTITPTDVHNAGGHLRVVCTQAAGAYDITLPDAFKVKGARVTLYKKTAGTDALAFDTPATNQIDAGSAGARYQNVTAEMGSLTVWADPASTAAVGIWRIEAFRGTWAAAA